MSFATGSPSTFKKQYRRHDRAERMLCDLLEARDVEVDRTGYDPHEDGTRVTGVGKQDRSADLTAAGLPVEVKTKKREEHIGNVPLRKWREYPDGTRFAWFQVDERGFHGSWSYVKGEAVAVDLEDSPFGSEQWVVARPLEPLDALLDELEAM